MAQDLSLSEIYQEGLKLQKNKDLQGAKIKYEHALQIAPNNVQINEALASLGMESQNTDMALHYLKKCIELEINTKKHQYNFLHIAKAAKRQAYALEVFTQLHKKHPGSQEILKEKAILASHEKQYGLACECYASLYATNAADPNYATQLGYSLASNGKYEQAQKFFRKHLERNPKQITPRVNYAILLNRHGDFNEAEAQFEQALELSPDVIDILYNYAITLRANQKYDNSLEINKRLLELRPDHPETYVHSAFCHLVKGDLKKGWEEYEWRWQIPAFARGKLNIPTWEGEDLSGKTLLLLSEQGFGDALQFIRYAPKLKEKCDHLILSTRKELAPLFANMGCFDEIVDQTIHPSKSDYCSALMSLPRHLGIDKIADIEPIDHYLEPSIKAPQDFTDLLAQNDKKKIGICWRGSKSHVNDDFRSIPFPELSTLLNNEEFQFVNLQIGANEDERLPQIIDATPFINNFEDTAAICKELDLVISVDTSLVHLCGACGIPVWTLISTYQDWRWFKKRTDSPWYPSMRIFRNTQPKKWERLISQVNKELVTNFSDTHS